MGSNPSPGSPALPPGAIFRFPRQGAGGSESARLLETLSGLRLPLSLLPAEAVPGALGCVEEIRAALWLRVNTLSSPEPEFHEDRLLNAEEAAQRLGYSVGTVYKRADEFPFTVRQSAGRVQFSSNGIDEYIRSFNNR